MRKPNNPSLTTVTLTKTPTRWPSGARITERDPVFVRAAYEDADGELVAKPFFDARAAELSGENGDGMTDRGAETLLELLPLLCDVVQRPEMDPARLEYAVDWVTAMCMVSAHLYAALSAKEEGNEKFRAAHAHRMDCWLDALDDGGNEARAASHALWTELHYQILGAHSTTAPEGSA